MTDFFDVFERAEAERLEEEARELQAVFEQEWARDPRPVCGRVWSPPRCGCPDGTCVVLERIGL